MLFPFVLLLAVASVQSSNPPAKDALALLTEVGQHYADAKSYHIEAIEENTSSNELQRFWHKTLLTAIVMPGGRYRYEGRSGNATAILVSDGTSQWDYHAYEHIYTQQPTPSEDAPTGWITGEAERGPDVGKANRAANDPPHR
jgi:outer membrane lipoprotein-sorting protein